MWYTVENKEKKITPRRPSISFLCPFRWVRVCAAPREVLGATSFFFAISGPVREFRKYEIGTN